MPTRWMPTRWMPTSVVDPIEAGGQRAGFQPAVLQSAVMAGLDRAMARPCAQNWAENQWVLPLPQQVVRSPVAASGSSDRSDHPASGEWSATGAFQLRRGCDPYGVPQPARTGQQSRRPDVGRQTDAPIGRYWPVNFGLRPAKACLTA